MVRKAETCVETASGSVSSGLFKSSAPGLRWGPQLGFFFFYNALEKRLFKSLILFWKTETTKGAQCLT